MPSKPKKPLPDIKPWEGEPLPRDPREDLAPDGTDEIEKRIKPARDVYVDRDGREIPPSDPLSDLVKPRDPSKAAQLAGERASGGKAKGGRE